MSARLHIGRDIQGAVTILRPEGEIDLSVSPQLRQAVLDALQGGGDLIVDLAGVPYIDSSGIAGLAEGLQAARRAGRRFALARPPESACKVLRIARLDQVFTILDTPDPGFGGTGGGG